MSPRKRTPNKDKAAMAAAAAAAAVVQGADDDDAVDIRAASGAPLSEVAQAVVKEGLSASTKEPRTTIKRLNEMDGKYATLDTVDSSTVSEEWIQRTYGGGKYRALMQGPLQDGKWGYIRIDTYEIDSSVPFLGSIMGRQARATLHNPDGSLVGSAKADADLNTLMKTQIVELVQSSADVRARDREASSTMMTMMMQMMKESSERNDKFMQLMMTMMSQKPTGPSLTELLAAVTPLVAPLLGTRKDPIDVATQLMALTGNNRGGGSQLSEIIAAVKELRETADLFGPGEREEDTSLLGTITRLAPQLLTMLTAEQRRAMEAVPAPAPAPAPPTIGVSAVPPLTLGAPPVAGASAPGESTVLSVPALLKPYVATLVEHAMNDDDPFDLGHSLSVMIPPMFRGAAAEFVEREDAAAVLITELPELAPYPAWVVEFVAGVRERFNPSEDEDEEPTPGDAPVEGLNNGV